MKRITLIIVIIILLIVPWIRSLETDGTIIYKSFLYKITKVHRINLESVDGYEKGIIVEFLGFEIINNVNIKSNTSMVSLSKEESCVSSKNLYYSNENTNIYLICLNDIYLNYNSKQSLKDYLDNGMNNIGTFFEKITDELIVYSSYNDGRVVVHKGNDLSIITCNNDDGTKDILIGDGNVELNSNICN